MGNWLRRNNFTRICDEVVKDVRELLLQPTFDLWRTAHTALNNKWTGSAKPFVDYFQKEWVDNSKYLQWALHARPAGVDTGDQKGEAYNYYLKAIIFNNLKSVELHTALFFLRTEFDNVDKVLSSPDLLLARYSTFEQSQRTHDANRMVVAAAPASAPIIANTPAPAAAMDLRVNSPSQLFSYDWPQLRVDEAMVYDLEDMGRRADAILASVNVPAAADPVLVTALDHLPARPVEMAVMGKARTSCPICFKEKRNNSCVLKICLKCCASRLCLCACSPQGRPATR